MKSCLSNVIAAAVFATACAAHAQKPVELTFYYPVAVGGPVTKIIDGMAADFSKENPAIKVTPIYSGTYDETLVKALTAHKSGKPPNLAVLLATDMFTLIDEDAVTPIDSVDAGGAVEKWVAGFYPAFMLDSQTGGKTWGIPFQRSTVVMYWNKDLFKEAGLDPERGPATWDELVEFSKKLTKGGPGGTTQWGLEIPSTGFPFWLFQGLTTPNDTLLMNQAGTETYFDRPGAIAALQFWIDLSAKHKVMPKGIIEWGTTPKDFFEKRAAIIWTTTGNLANIRKNADFPVGVGLLPAKKHYGSPTGGGNFYIFKNAPVADQQASLKFIKWMSSPTQAARWSIATGYVAVTPDAWNTPEMRKYTAEVPQALVARDQLQYAVAGLSTHENPRVTKVLNDALQAALVGSKTPAEALKDAQREATRILRPYKR